MCEAEQISKRLPRFIQEGRIVQTRCGGWKVTADNSRDAEDIEATFNGQDRQIVEAIERAEKAEADDKMTVAAFETAIRQRDETVAQRDALAAALKQAGTELQEAAALVAAHFPRTGPIFYAAAEKAKKIALSHEAPLPEGAKVITDYIAEQRQDPARALALDNVRQELLSRKAPDLVRGDG